jgi:hypothetical protein
MTLLGTLREILREIFDESAFERYCSRERVTPSREAYANFLQEEKTPRARCC